MTIAGSLVSSAEEGGFVAPGPSSFDLPPVFTAFYEDETARTCGQCGALHPGKG